MNTPTDRRWFLQRALAALPALHAGALAQAAGSADDGPSPATRTSSGPRFAELKLHAPVGHFEALEAFYRDTLGLPATRDAEGSLRITAGATSLRYLPAENGTEPYYHVAFNIPHNKLDAARAWMKPRWELVKNEQGEDVVYHFERWNAHAVYFVDPAGNILEFIARHTLKNESKGEFSPADILCASEIGVVTPNVTASVDQLIKSGELGPYHGRSDGFTAVGDEQGLFIVVAKGRQWLSSDRHAQVHPAHATVRGIAKRIELADARFIAEAADQEAAVRTP